MKKITLTLIFITLSTIISFSQIYLRANAGYAIPLNSDLMGEETNTVYNPNSGIQTTDVKAVYGSYGNGASFHIAFGNTLPNGIIGYDLEVGYLISKKFNITSTEDFGSAPTTSTQKNSAKSFQFSPSIFFKAHTGNFEPYTKIGPVLAITNSTIETSNGSFNALGVESKGQLSLGLKTSLGINFFPDSKIQLYTEINIVSMAYAPKEGEITKYVSDGVDMTDRLSQDQKKVTFEKDYTFEGSQPVNLQTRPSYSMGSIGLQVGVKFNL